MHDTLQVPQIASPVPVADLVNTSLNNYEALKQFRYMLLLNHAVHIVIQLPSTALYIQSSPLHARHERFPIHPHQV